MLVALSRLMVPIGHPDWTHPETQGDLRSQDYYTVPVPEGVSLAAILVLVFSTLQVNAPVSLRAWIASCQRMWACSSPQERRLYSAIARRVEEALHALEAEVSLGIGLAPCPSVVITNSQPLALCLDDVCMCH